MAPPKQLTIVCDGQRPRRLQDAITDIFAYFSISKDIFLVHTQAKVKRLCEQHSYYTTAHNVFNDDMCNQDTESLEGCLLGFDDEAPIHLTYDGFSHTTGAAGNYFACHGKQYFSLSGEVGAALPQLAAVNLALFAKRYPTLDVTQDTLNVKRPPFTFAELEGSQHRVIDHELLGAWVRHQYLVTLFPCTYDPFYEEQGVLCQERCGHSTLEPVYTIPEGVTVHFRRATFGYSDFDILVR